MQPVPKILNGLSLASVGLLLYSIIGLNVLYSHVCCQLLRMLPAKVLVSSCRRG